MRNPINWIPLTIQKILMSLDRSAKHFAVRTPPADYLVVFQGSVVYIAIDKEFSSWGVFPA